MQFDYLMNETRAVDYLGDRLGDGTLVLILGAGVSVGFGLPDWVTLIARMGQKSGAAVESLAPDCSAERLQVVADQIKREQCHDDEKAFARLVRECLYEGVELSSIPPQSGLLTALGALMMGSRRGSVRRVVSFNFDSVLEWYLSLHGFVVQVITAPPQMEGAEDVRIYHPHGFLPHPILQKPGSEFVMLGLQAANLRIGTQGDPWFELIRHVLRTGVGLVVGMSSRSFRDRAIAPLLASVGNEVRSERPTAFWLVQDHEDEVSEGEFLGSNVVPLAYDTFARVPAMLLAVCQKAAADMRR